LATSSRSQKNTVVSFAAETIATGFGSGNWPFVAPATVGTFAALIAYWLLDVIDEWVGVWVTVLFLPVTWPWMIAGFFVFRALDILKPLGVRKIEAWPGGWGIMFDDIAAGVIGAVILNAVRLIFFA
jgi:phosphatidylglycerophosphatase A